MLYFCFRVFEIFFNTKQGLENMPRLNLQERTKIIEFWHKVKSVKQVQRLYCDHFGVHMRDAPNFRTIKSIVAKFTYEGTVCDLHKRLSGRKRSGRSEDSVDMVRQAVVQSPKKSIRRLSAETNLHRSTVQRILRQDIHAFPHKIQSESLLTDEQKGKRLHFANWFAEKLEEDTDFLKKLHLTDECHAHQSGRVNKQNFRYWGTDNPGNTSTEMVPRSVLKVTMWVAVGWYGVIGPYFFEDD